jgi:hypothetical protein
MKCLGLRNKPMSEVHPEHMLTGPKEDEEEEILEYVCSKHYIITFFIIKYRMEIYYVC